MGEQQNPSVYGSTEGAPTLPVLRPGSAYAKAFPGRVHPPVDASWVSLGPRGIPTDVTAVWASQMPSPNDLQRSAVNDFGVLDGDSLLVVAPTGSGKTMIGELAAVQHALRGSRTVMLLPMRALVNDKYAHFSRTYGQGFAVVRATGEVSDQVGDLLGGHFDIALLTYEKFLALLIAFPHILRGVSLVVVDEAQNISDPGRGPDLELLMTLLRSGHARGGAPQIVALSAVIGDTHGLERWLGAGLLRSDSRPVPLRESVVDAAGAARHLLPDGTESREPLVVPRHGTGSQSSKPVVVPLVARLAAEDKKVIVFRPFKGETVGTARYLAEALGGPPARAALDALPAGDPSSVSVDLRQVLAAGVGFHNSDLDRDERRVLETAFRDPASDLRVIVATTTLAMGINTPAEAVVIAGLMHPGNQPYSVAEYKNMAGRAGRPGFATAGESYIVAADRLSPREAWDRYVAGRPEDVRSHFLSAATDPQTLILRALTALGRSVLEPELVDLLDNSFAVWQLLDRGQGGWDQQALRSDLDALVRAELVDREPSGDLTLTRLGQYAGESGLQVRSVTNVSSALRWARAPLSAADLVLLAQVTAETDQTLLPVHAKSKQEQARWPTTVARFGAQPGLVSAMHVGGGLPLPRCKRAAACLLFASESPLTAVEAELMQHLRGASAAGPVRSVASRTRDVLGAVAMIASVKGVDPADDALADDLAVMLEIGLPRRLAAVGAVLGDALTRAHYLALDRKGLRDAASIRDAGPDRLAEVIGSVASAAAMARLNRPGAG